MLGQDAVEQRLVVTRVPLPLDVQGAGGGGRRVHWNTRTEVVARTEHWADVVDSGSGIATEGGP